MNEKRLCELLEPLRAGNRKPEDQARKIEVLTQMVFDLLLEVEALRSMALNPRAGLVDIYAEAYRETALTSHCSTGPTDGWDKLLATFYPQGYEEASGASSGKRVWRETLVLERLGLTPEEIDSFKQLAMEMESYTGRLFSAWANEGWVVSGFRIEFRGACVPASQA